MQLLLEYGVHPGSGVGCLLEAAAANVDILAIQMLCKHGLHVMATTADGSTLLHLLGSSEPEFHGHGVNSRRESAESLVRWLLAEGANPLVCNHKQQTAIDVCWTRERIRAIMQAAVDS